MEFLQECVNDLSKQHREAIDSAITDFLIKEGFDIHEPIAESARAIKLELEARGEQLRCEIFYKLNGNSFSMQVLPFIEPISEFLPREEIYRILGLKEQGYMP